MKSRACTSIKQTRLASLAKLIKRKEIGSEIKQAVMHTTDMLQRIIKVTLSNLKTLTMLLNKIIKKTPSGKTQKKNRYLEPYNLLRQNQEEKENLESQI